MNTGYLNPFYYGWFIFVTSRVLGLWQVIIFSNFLQMAFCLLFCVFIAIKCIDVQISFFEFESDENKKRFLDKLCKHCQVKRYLIFYFIYTICILYGEAWFKVLFRCWIYSIIDASVVISICIKIIGKNQTIFVMHLSQRPLFQNTIYYSFLNIIYCLAIVF